MLLLFFDGACGLCHRAVLFLIRADPHGQALRFAPIAGTTFASLIPPETRRRLPDSLVARTEDGRLFVRSDALLRALDDLGTGWRAAATLLRLVPRPLRDLAYDLVARSRRRVLGRPEACSVAPEDTGRFLP